MFSDKLKQFKSFTVRTARNIHNDRIFARANSLAYKTFIAMIPLTMVIYSFGGFSHLSKQIMDALGELLLPEQNQQIWDVFTTFTDNAEKLGSVGTLLFLFTSVMLLNAMESHFNDIFRARPRKNQITRIGLYIASLATISLLFGAGSRTISNLLNIINEQTSGSRASISFILAVLKSMIGLILLFTLLSEAKFKLSSLLLGTLSGAIAFQAAKTGFTIWTAYSVNQSIIYGSLVFVPVLLIWLNIEWLTILTAAEITYAHQVKISSAESGRFTDPSFELKLIWKLYLYISGKFSRGEQPPDAKELVKQLKSNENIIFSLLKLLKEKHVIIETSDTVPSYVPSSPPSSTTAVNIINAIFGESQDSSPEEITGIISESLKETLKDKTIEDFINQNL